MTSNPVSSLRTELLLVPLVVGFVVALSTYIVPVLTLQTPSQIIQIFGFPLPWRATTTSISCENLYGSQLNLNSGYLNSICSVSVYGLVSLAVDTVFYIYIAYFIALTVMIFAHAKKNRSRWEKEHRSIVVLSSLGENAFCYGCDRTTRHEVRYRYDSGIIEKLFVCRVCGEAIKEPGEQPQ